MAGLIIAGADTAVIATSTTATVSATYTAGDRIIVWVKYDSTTVTATVADGTHTFTQIGGYALDSVGSRRAAMFEARGVAGGAFTITATFSSTVANRALAYWRGTGLDTSAAQASNSSYQDAATTAANNVTSGSYTPTSQPNVLFGITYNKYAASTITAGTGFTSLGALVNFGTLGGDNSLSEYQRTTSTASTASTFTSSAVDGYLTMGAVFGEAGTGPTITVQPTSKTTNSGSTATFTASASGTGGAITYQWQDNRTGSFTNVASGGTSASYTTPATDATYQGRQYRVVATDSNGSVTSGTATLGVIGFPLYLWDTSVQSGNDVWLRDPLTAGSTTNKTATMAITLDGVTVAAAATLGHTATMAPTLADITTAISGTIGHSATSAFTLDDIVFAASATVTGGASLTATMAFTLDGVTVASSATAGHIATMTATLDGVTITSAATAGHSATSAFTLGDISFASSATAGHTATSAITLDGLTPAINSVTGHPATSAFTLDSITFAASATAVSGKSATLAIVLDDITVNSAVVSGHSATMAFTLDDVLVAMTATNSNAPPVTAVQDYFIEIRSFTDRRRI